MGNLSTFLQVITGESRIKTQAVASRVCIMNQCRSLLKSPAELAIVYPFSLTESTRT